MYEHQGLQDIFFMMLYGGATLFAVVACLYLLFTQGNMFLTSVNPSKSLRRWTAAFMAAVAASHAWWVILSIYLLKDDRLMRHIIAITLDRLTFVPLMMVIFLRMLQDRRRPLWPIFAAMVPLAAISVISIITRSETFEWYTKLYSIILCVAFTLYYILAVRNYSHWLRDNYADLQNKEVWQSLMLLACIVLIYAAYATNEGALATEYLSQINTLIIIAFVLWRVETLQLLSPTTEEVYNEEGPKESNAVNIGTLLEQHCKNTQLYLQHDLSLQQLATAIGTNRTYLSAYFAQQDITYNAYINRLRIDHFMQLYSKVAASSHITTAKTIAQQSGFHSYVTFSVAFKKYMGTTVTEWMKEQS